MLELKQTFICEWCMVRCESKNGHPTHMCWIEIGLRAEIILTILDTIVNINEEEGGEGRGDRYDR